jgi:hypothetical protein
MNNIIYDIDTIFPIDENHIETYNKKLIAGQDHAYKSKIAVLCLARNIAQKYLFPFRQIKILLSYFDKDSRVYIYENDSIDQTPQLIRDTIKKSEYKQFSLYTEKLKTKYLPLSRDKIRTTNMANARNKCYNLINKKDIQSFDFFFVLDIDFKNISLNGILNSMGWMYENPQIKAMSGNSYSEHFKLGYLNYDSFAFRLNNWHQQHMPWFPQFNLPIGSDPIMVYSAFGGLTIYRKGFYQPLYSGEDCEHVQLHKKLKNGLKDFQLFYNPSQIMIV